VNEQTQGSNELAVLETEQFATEPSAEQNLEVPSQDKDVKGRRAVYNWWSRDARLVMRVELQSDGTLRRVVTRGGNGCFATA